MKENNSLTFPVGYHNFHRNQVYNFQLNRWYSIGFARFEDMQEAGRKVNSFKDWKNEMIRLAQIALEEKRYFNAAIYYRSAEFYIIKKDSAEKKDLYAKFTDIFYKAIDDENFKKFKVPYQDSFLPALKISPEQEKKGTIVLHGGFDSFIEEWYFMMKYLAAQGYEIIGFEGPGQGAALKTYGLPLDIEWEKPVGAVLDYFNLSGVTLIGFSMGGWYCLRAAAHEKRVARAIASGHSIDYMKSLPKILYDMHIFFIEKFPDYTNRMIEKSIR